MTRTKSINLDEILDAADEVLRTQGVYRFTQDAVAEQAGISKGGLVYSYPTKDSLIQAMLVRKQVQLTKEAEEEAKAFSDHPYAQLLGFMEALKKEDEEKTQSAANLMTAVIHAPDVLEVFRDFYRKNTKKFFNTKTRSGRKAQIAFLTLQGLIWVKFLGVKHYSKKEWDEIISDAQKLLTEK